MIHNPALLQLATGRTVYLIRLNLLDSYDELLPILTSPTCLKVGVAVKDDIIGLQKITPFKASGFVDIATLSKNLGIQTIGLRSLTAIFLKFRISKKPKFPIGRAKNCPLLKSITRRRTLGSAAKSSSNYVGSTGWRMILSSFGKKNCRRKMRKNLPSPQEKNQAPPY